MLCAPLFLWAQAPVRPSPAHPGTVHKPAPTTGADQPKFKGIWEPINYKEDVEFTDVYFVTPEEGWASGLKRTNVGEGGFILHTRDGGNSWEIQVGDPQSATRSIQQLLFIDKTHGWATDWSGKMLRTTDGENWEAVSDYPPLSPYSFASSTIGIYIHGDQIFRTQDGGRTWKPAFTCRIKAEIQGLMREQGCNFAVAHMPSPAVGYAVTTAIGDIAFALAKTVDGGISWTLTPVRVSGRMGGDGHVYFLDEQTGFVSLYKWGGNVYATNDGGQTWRGAVGLESSWMRFADPEVGWSIQGNHPLTYTADGGKHWLSRQIPFPANVSAFSLPRRDRGYVVGDHGMIYRYRVVPVTYQAAAHSLDAPVMPGFDSPVFGEVATMKDVVAQLQAKLPAPVPSQGGSQTFAQAVGQSSGQVGGQSGSFQQDTAALGTGAGGVPTASGVSSGVAGSGAFQQDTGTGPVAGGYMDSCCGPLIQQLETTANSFATNVPTFSQRFRNLNLIIEGLDLVNNIVNQANTLKQSIRALRQAKDAQSAGFALNTVQSQVNGISSSGRFVQDTSTPPQP